MNDRNEPKRFLAYCRRLFLRVFQWCSERLIKAKFRNGALIKRRSILTGCLSLVLLSSVAISLSAQTTNGCELPPKGSAPRIKIDVTAQGVSNRNLSYPNAKQVEILLTNMNPYKYRYSISTRQSTEADVVSGALKELLKAAGGAGQHEFLNQISKSFRIPSRIPLIREINNTVLEHIRLAADIRAQIDNDRINCKVLRSKSKQLLRTMPDFKITQWEQKINQQKPENHNSVKEAIAEAKKQRNKDSDLLTRIRQIESLERPFSYLYSLDKSGGFTNSVVEIHRVKFDTDQKSIKEDSRELIASLTIHMGSAPVSFSVGVGFSTVDSEVVVRQASKCDHLKTCNATRDVTNKFGLASESSFKPTAILLLNGHMVSRPKFTFGPSIGLSFGERNSGPQLDYLVGASIGLRNNLLWLTGGLHATRVEKLSGGFKTGDVIPSELQDPLPTTSGFKAGFMFAISFRIK